MAHPFAGARFDHALFLVLCNRVVTVAAAATALARARGARRGAALSLTPAAPLASYAAVALTNVGASACQYEAVKRVGFAAATVGKCLKPVPVLLWGWVVLGRRCSRVDAGATVAVVTGCWLFLGGGGASATTSPTTTTTTGALLLLAYLALDGLTANLQQRIFKRGAAVSAADQTLFVAAFAAAAALGGLLLGPEGRTLAAAFAYVARHPSTIAWIAALSATATAGSLLIAATVRAHGALALALAMSVRQLASVAVSAATYGRPLTARQWAGAGVVGVGLLVRARDDRGEATGAPPRRRRSRG